MMSATVWELTLSIDKSFYTTCLMLLASAQLVELGISGNCTQGIVKPLEMHSHPSALPKGMHVPVWDITLVKRPGHPLQ